MRVAIIGAGAAGLSSARHVIECGFDCDIFEMNDQLGGTWVYTDNVGKDKYGFPVYSAMYKGLRTNLPKEVMGFPDFPVPEQQKSYLTQPEVLEFLNMYANRFSLKPFIKFNSLVTDIRPIGKGRYTTWKLTYINKPTKKDSTEVYDVVMICNGHYNDPAIPDIPGQDNFTGKIEHSHTFRSPEFYKGKSILVVGAGPSGLDITLQVSKVAEKVVLSHHLPRADHTVYPENVHKKPDIKCITGIDTVEFVDGSCCCFDSIVLCTGYNYNFPFLHESCGITVDQNFIQPLYRHMINIDRPTMCFIGIPFNVCTFHMFDLQARYYCRFLDGSMQLPSAEDMRMHTEKDMQMRWVKGYTKRQAHMMGTIQENYYNDLAAGANTSPIAPVLVKLRDVSVNNLYDNLLNFREDRYKIVDDENFIKIS